MTSRSNDHGAIAGRMSSSCWFPEGYALSEGGTEETRAKARVACALLAEVREHHLKEAQKGQGR